MCMYDFNLHESNTWLPEVPASYTSYQEKKNCVTKYFLLLFSICLPLPIRETTPSRVIIFNVYCKKTHMSPDGLISSVGTSFKTCLLANKT